MPCPRAVVFQALAEFAPLHLAEPWDNVGLLMDPVERDAFERAFLTIDLDDETLGEALAVQADLIVAYHPPLFAGLKRLRIEVPTERILIRALKAGLTIYSPHTALDAAAGGMAQWLSGALGSGRVRPIVARSDEPDLGAGRIVELDTPVSVEQACARVKLHLGLDFVRLSRAPTGPAEVRTVAVCPGAGGSLFEKVGACDLLLTGEMRHHDVLQRRAQGCHVILTDHTNSERAYLPILAGSLQARCTGLEVRVSRADADPLQVL